MPLPTPPSAPPDVGDAKAGLDMDPPHKRLFESNGGFRHGRVMRPAHSGRMLDAKRHEARAAVDAGPSFVGQEEEARDADAVRLQQRESYDVMLDGVGEHMREDRGQEMKSKLRSANGKRYSEAAVRPLGL